MASRPERKRLFNPFNQMIPDTIERRSRDTRPQPAWRGADPATPCKAAQPPPPPAMKRLALLLPKSP